jgi:hypothetical protein
MTGPDPKHKSDEVLVVQDFWDGPVSGVATFEGSFHAFKRVYDEVAQGWSKANEYMLQPLDGADLAAFNEMDAIFKAWRADHDSGKVEPHPLLPEATGATADRYKELYQKIDAILHTQTARTLRCVGLMSPVPAEARYVVEWTRS